MVEVKVPMPPAPAPLRWAPTAEFVRAYWDLAEAGGRRVSVPAERKVEGETVRWSITVARESCGAWSGHAAIDLLLVSAAAPDEERDLYARYSVLMTGAPGPGAALQALASALVAAGVVRGGRWRTSRAFLDAPRRVE